MLVYVDLTGNECTASLFCFQIDISLDSLYFELIQHKVSHRNVELINHMFEEYMFVAAYENK